MTATQAAMIMMSGSADLENITITENGEYESVDHDGFGVVTVEVPTMVECAEEVAEILGVDTSQEWDCDDIKAKAQEVVDENEEMQECCDEVLDVIHDYDPTYDPHPDPPDPTNPTIPEKIQEIIDEESGYVFPADTPINPIIELVGDDPVTDNTSHKRIEKEIINEINPVTGLLDLSFKGYLVDTITGDRLQLFSWGYGASEYISSKITVDDATTGTYTVTLVYYYHGRPQGERTETTTYTSSALIGYGADGNTFSVKNKGE